MRNLFQLLWRYHFLILFLLLELGSFVLVVRNNNFQQTTFVNSANVVTGTFYNWLSSAKTYIHLKKTNANLAAENAHLLSLLPDTTNIHLAPTTIKNDTYHQQYEYISAHVINNSINRRNNYLTLNVGTVDGVRPEMGVICGNGVVGKVKNVSEHFCTVMSVLHNESKVSAKFKKNNYYGSLVWEGGSSEYATLNDIALHVPVAVGDSIITTSYSPLYPEGIMVGIVSHFDRKPGQNFYSIKVKLATDFSALTYVYVVLNKFKMEQEKLESLNKHD